MVGVAFNGGHHFGVNDVLEVTLVHKDVVNEVPMFGQGMHPGCLKSVILLEDGVSDDKLLLSAKLQLQAPVVIAVTNAVSAKYSFPGICILAHSSIEITKDYHLWTNELSVRQGSGRSGFNPRSSHIKDLKI